METKACSSLLLLLLLLTTLILSSAVPTTRDIHIVRRDLMASLNDLCKKTTNPNLCVQTIQPHFHGSADPFQALSAEVDATLDEAKKTLADIKTLLTKPDNGKSLKDSLKVCQDQYSSMLDSIADTKASIGKKDVITAKFKFSAVISFQSACKDSFGGQKIPFLKDSDEVYQLGGNCLDIIADIEKALPAKPAPVQQAPSAFSNVVGTVS
ncbi:uncharacterized protein LOC109788941 [Cajanus cajan]|uniref:Pectinesterase inhibitor domain-containing protein n=1 Tax=Cajanus cajan TaxID=3821 RepID=A0A151R973_CAJCA|nr:uncharacterized protein LOC109788941 [Cajanus cajan]KYP39091.1 hypothetical protein KK1_039619 [Cajanus cajan]